MRRPIACHRPLARRGISLIEAIIIIFALLLLMAIVLPWIQHTHEPSRRMQCLNNLKNLGLAATNFATTHDGRLPLLAEPAPGLAAKDSQGNTQYTSWVIFLMPYMDRADALEYISMMKTSKEASEAMQYVLAQSYAILQCPNDVNHFMHPGGLSYGANIGYGAWRGTSEGITTNYDFGATDHSASAVDWNNNGKRDATDKELARATGLFWNADADQFHMTLEDVNEGDGTGPTILIAEAVNLPLMHEAGPAKNGLNPRAVDVGVGLGIEALGLKKSAKPNLFVDRTSKASKEYSQYFKPGGVRKNGTGPWPAASSMHSGVVNVVYADGHAGSISNDINWAVWASLHSPSGVQHGQAAISDADY